MTLILTEITEFGIAMAADSAVTTSYNLGRHSGHRVLAGVRKLQPVHYLNAGISCWGVGEIGGLDTDIWLENFIKANEHIHKLNDFAMLLQNELRRVLGMIEQNTAGFHLAGFVEKEGRKMPTFFHVHNGPSQYPSIAAQIDSALFNANQDMPPEDCPPGYFKITRNGDFQLYAELFGAVESFFNTRVRPLGIEIPSPLTLGSIAEYLRFQIKTVSEIYKLSNLVPSIGGPVTTLTISDQGIMSYETK